MKMFSRREAAHVVAMVGMLVVGVRCAGMEEVESEHPHLMLDNALLVAERTSLQVCVELAPSLQERSGELLDTLKSDLALLRERHPLWEKSGFGQAPVRVKLGCPGAAMPSERLESKGALVGPGVSERPSPFRTFLYVLDDTRARAVLGKEEPIRARAELMKVEDHVLAEVSTALVIRASDLGTPSFQETWLPTGVGLPPLHEPAAVPAADFMPKVSGETGMEP